MVWSEQGILIFNSAAIEHDSFAARVCSTNFTNQFTTLAAFLEAFAALFNSCTTVLFWWSFLDSHSLEVVEPGPSLIERGLFDVSIIPHLVSVQLTHDLVTSLPDLVELGVSEEVLLTAALP
jgi:hypothetical protein